MDAEKRIRELERQVESEHANAEAGWAQAHRLDAALSDYQKLWARARYNADSLVVWEKSTAFMEDASFRRAYMRGMDSGHHILREPGSRDDIHIEWRIHTLLWAASHAAKLDGDFVECGVNTGIYSLAILDYTGTRRDFWLFDTYDGIPVEQASEAERSSVIEINAANYDDCYAQAMANFAPYPNAHLIRGRVPETLASVDIDRVAFLSIDMNIAAPERAALDHFWPKLVPGGLIVLDDYGWLIHAEQREMADAWASCAGTKILTLPTGQGLIVKA